MDPLCMKGPYKEVLTSCNLFFHEKQARGLGLDCEEKLLTLEWIKNKNSRIFLKFYIQVMFWLDGMDIILLKSAIYLTCLLSLWTLDSLKWYLNFLGWATSSTNPQNSKACL